MRLRRAACACAVAASSLALLAPGSSAFMHRSPDGRCAVSISVAPKEITAGEPVTVFGRLLCRGAKRGADQVVKLFHHIPGTPGFTYVQSALTNAQGFYEFPRADGAVETSRIWHVRVQGAESANAGVRVAAQVSLSGPPEGTQILTGPANAVTFTGTVTPADVGALMFLQRQNAATGGEWNTIGIVHVQTGGGFTIAHTFRYPGDANLRVLMRSQRRNVPSTSSTLEYEVSQAQNPTLTIDASSNPIDYGQSVTISGIVTAGADQPVTLLARTVHQGFAPVGHATTDAAGNYVFPAQSPINSTFYEVQSGPTAAVPPAGSPSTTPGGSGAAPAPAGGRASAVLAVGVRDLLTAQVSATSVQAGQSLTFSGSVAPDHTGDLVYLERQDPSGPGFHVAQVAVIGADSTFSITHQVFGAGTDVFRVLVPGGPENFGVASQPFTVTVTPAPAALLKPEAPGNTTQPTEGSTSPSGEKAPSGEKEQ
jgi:hypothetical protein